MSFTPFRKLHSASRADEYHFVHQGSWDPRRIKDEWSSAFQLVRACSLSALTWLRAEVNAGTRATYLMVHGRRLEDWDTLWKKMASTARVGRETNSACALGIEMQLTPEFRGEAALLTERCKSSGLDHIVVAPGSHCLPCSRENSLDLKRAVSRSYFVSPLVWARRITLRPAWPSPASGPSSTRSAMVTAAIDICIEAHYTTATFLSSRAKKYGGSKSDAEHGDSSRMSSTYQSVEADALSGG